MPSPYAASDAQVSGNLIKTGRVGRPHGLEGFLYLDSENTSDNIISCDRLFVMDRQSRMIEVKAERIKEGKGHLRLIKFQGFSDRQKASALSGSALFISERYARPKRDGEVYYKDLIGLAVVFQSKRIGVVSGLFEGAQSLILEVKRSDGKTFLVPYMKVFVSEPDLEVKEIGLLEGGLLE